MEIEELKTIWQQYDLKLDKLEKLNKKLVLETLSKKPRRKLNFLKFQSIYGLIVVPIILITVFYPYLKIENIDLRLIIGCILTLIVVGYLYYFLFKCFTTLKRIDLGADTIIESVRKVNGYKAVINSNQKHKWITYPVLFAGVILIGWKGFTFDIKTIFFMAVIFVFAFLWGIKHHKIHQNRIDRLEKEILELNEYKD
jgi:hypothetical protein